MSYYKIVEGAGGMGLFIFILFTTPAQGEGEPAGFPKYFRTPYWV